MTDSFILILLLMLIGAIVGGGTNILAIRMLFRPYEPFYIGEWRLPFTPGLIPKRRAEIADSLGKMVEEYLVTPEGIQKKMKDGVLLKEVEDRLTKGINELLKDERTLDEWLEAHLEKRDQMKLIREFAEKGLETKLLSWIYEYKDQPVQEWLPVQWQDAIEAKMPLVAENILSKTEDYLQSEEGRARIDTMVTRFFESKGSFTGMFGRMAHRFSLSSAVTNELIRFMRQPHTKQMLTDLLTGEYRSALKKAPSVYFSEDMLEDKVKAFSEAVVGKAPVLGEWGEPLNMWSGKYEDFIKETLLPAFMATSSSILAKYIKSMIKKIGIRDIVSTEVNQFPLARLEHMMLMIARKELKMIAMLGGIIGGLIGFIQGLVIVFFI